MKNPLRGCSRALDDLTKKDSERAVTAKMRLSALVILCGVACRALAPTKVLALCRKRQALARLNSSKKELLNRRAKHTIETSHTPKSCRRTARNAYTARCA